MALNINTRKLLEQYQQEFEKGNSADNSPINRPAESLNIADPKQATQRLLGIVDKFSPLPTSKKFEDYSGYIKGTIDPIFGDIDEQRAQEQSTFAKFATILPRIGTKVVAEVSKIPGALYGMADWGISGFNFDEFEQKVNNTWVRSIEEAHRATNDAILPVYTRRVVEQGGLLRQIVSPEFWANEGADGIGFLVSMMGPGLLTRAAGVGSGITKLAKLSKLAKAETAAKIGAWTDDIVSAGINTIVESTAEGIEASNALKNRFKQEKFQELLSLGINETLADELSNEYVESQEVKTKIGKAGANTVKANLAILLGPNIIDQKWLFSGLTRGALADDLVQNKLSRIVSGIGKEGAEQVGRYTGKELRQDFLKKFGAGVIKEGFFEEGMQFASAKYFEDKAALDKDGNFLDDLAGTLNTYVESLSDIDMQKSIFLGSVLGGVMGGIGTLRNKRLEDKILFGDTKKKTTGLANLLEQNFVKRFETVGDITVKNADGTLRYDSDGNPVLDINKARAWAKDIINDEKNKKLLDIYREAGLDEDIELAKMIHDFNYMLPFLQQEGGMGLLELHIDQLSKKQAEFLKNELGIDSRDVESVKKELKEKAQQFNTIYQDTIADYKTVKLTVPEEFKSIKEDLDIEILNTRISNQLIQKTLINKRNNLQKQSNQIQTEIAKLESASNITNAEETKLASLQKNKETIDTQIKDMDSEIQMYKDSYNEMIKKESVQEELHERIKEAKRIKELAAQEAAKSVETPEEAAAVISAIDSTNLPNNKKKDVKDTAQTTINNKEAETALTKQADENTLRALAKKVFTNFSAGKIVDPLTQEEETIIQSNVETFQRYFDELKNASEEKERVSKATAAILNDIKKAEEFSINNIEKISDDFYATEVFTYSEETSTYEQTTLEASSEEELLTKIADHYNNQLDTISKLLNIPRPNYNSKALKVLAELQKDNDELTPVPPNNLGDENNLHAKANKSIPIRDALVAIVPALAYRSKQVVDNTSKDKFDESGKIILEENFNEDLLSPDKYREGTELFAEIDTESAFYPEYQNDIESIPIKLTDSDGNFVGYIHEVSWYDNKDMLNPALKVELKEQTRTMRNKFMENGKIVNKKFKLRIVSKTPGWLNRGNKQFTINEAFGKDSRVKIGTMTSTIVRTGSNLSGINWAKDDSGMPIGTLLNKSELSGIVIAAVPTANGTYLPTRLNQVPVEKADKTILDKFLRNTVAILMNGVVDSTLNKNDLQKQLSPYFYAQLDLTPSQKQNYLLSNKGILFAIDLFDSGTERNVVVDLDFGTDSKAPISGYVPFKIVKEEDGIKIYRIDRRNPEFKAEVSPKEFEELLRSQLSKKYLNYDQKLMDQWEAGNKIKILESDENYNLTEVEVDYRDFVSENNILTTRVHGVTKKDGKITYVTQPTIQITPNNFTEVLTEVAEETQVSVEEVQTSEFGTEDDFNTYDFEDISNEFEENVEDFLVVKPKIDYINSNIRSFSNISNLRKENELVNSLTASAIQFARTKSLDLDENPDALLDEIKDQLKIRRNAFIAFSTTAPTKEESARFKVTPSKETNAIIAKNIQGVLDNYERVYNEDGSVKFVGYRAKIELELAKIKFTPEEQDMLEALEENQQEELHVDNKNFKTDPEKSASSRVKRELYSIPLKENGRGRLSIIGLPVVRDYSNTFSTIIEALANEDVNDMLSELEELASSPNIKDEIYSQVLEIINKNKGNKNSSFVNEFISVFKKQRADFKTIIIYPNTTEVDGKKTVTNPRVTVIDTNKAGASSLLMEGWRTSHEQQLISLGILSFNKDKNTYTINQETAKNYTKSFVEAVMKTQANLMGKVTKGDLVTVEDFNVLSDAFKVYGLEVSPEALNKLYTTYMKRPKKLSGLKVPDVSTVESFSEFINNNFLFIFNGYHGKEIETDIPVPDEGYVTTAFRTQYKNINVLARYEAIVNPSVVSNSFRNGNGDIIYGFVNPSHLSNTIDKLKKLTAIENLDDFSKHSTWAYITDKVGEVSLNNSSLKDLGLYYFDSIKNGKSKKDSISLESMNPMEKELTKVSAYHNGGGKVGLFFTVAPSDKTTFSLIQAQKQEVLKNDLSPEGKLRVGTPLVDKLFDLFVQSEINRINSVINAFKDYKSKKIQLSELLNEYNFIVDKNGDVQIGAGSYFFLLPQFNDFFAQEIKLAQQSSEPIKSFASPKRLEEAKAKMVDLINQFVDLKVNHWNSLNLYNKMDSYVIKTLRKQYKGINENTAIASDYVINTMVSYANQYMLITGDPAKFAKTKGWNGTVEDWRTLIDTTAGNIFKRAAKDIAPGYEGLFEESEQKYTAVFINEPSISPKEMYKNYEGVLKDLVVANSKAINLADAQVWSSLPEHLRVLNAIGRISKATKDTLIQKYNNYMKDRTNPANKFTDAELGVILQPLKPVEVGWTNVQKAVVPLYIKSSRFPLIPQLTEGLEIDKMLTFMYENDIDIVVPQTAVKTGFSNSISIYDNGQLNIPEGKLDINKKHSLDRSIFRIQQDVPYDPDKSKILEGSQLKKLKYSDLELGWKFNLSNDPNKEYQGFELKELDDRIHNELYRRAYNDFLKDIEAEEQADGDISFKDFTKLTEIMIKESVERGFDINDVILLSHFMTPSGESRSSVPLFMHPAMPKIEPLLNSLIKNNILINKFPGKSYVQGSSMGFQFAKEGDKETLDKLLKKQGVVLTSAFSGKLNYSFVKKGEKEILYADVFVPWYFKEDINQFLNEDGTLNEDKIDPEMLSLIGYRIPTQGHNSMIKLRVAGFLPKSSGDLIIIPPDLVKQMGSDFDVDKLYVHRFNYNTDYDFKELRKFAKDQLTEEELNDLEYVLNFLLESEEDISFWADNHKNVYNKYKKLISENKVNFVKGIKKVIVDNFEDLEKLNKKQLQNLSLDITHAILENEEVAKRTIKPLDTVAIPNAIADLETNKPRVDRINTSRASETSLLFDELHSQFVDINAAGKLGVGVSSIASTGHVLSQYAGLYIQQIPTKEGVIEKSVMFTDKKGNVPFNEVEGTKNGVKQTSVKIHSYSNHVSSGLWRLDRIYNIEGELISDVLKNIQTEAVDNANNQNLYPMNLNRHTFDVALFLAKAGLTEKYIAYYLNQPIIKQYIEGLNSISDISSTEFTVGKEAELAKELGYLPFDEIPVISLEEMVEAIKMEGVNIEDPAEARRLQEFNSMVLSSFVEYKELASKFSGVLRSINVDTRFLGKNLDSNIVKQEDYNDNVEPDKTEGGKTPQFGNLENLKETLQYGAYYYGIEKSIKLFNNLAPYGTKAMNTLRENFLRNSDKERLSEKTATELNKGLRNSLWVETIKRTFSDITDLNNYRRNLLFGTSVKDMNSLAHRAFSLRKTNDNAFLKFLEITLSNNSDVPSVITFPTGGDIETDFGLKMQQSFLDLYNNPETKQIARDFLIYSLTNGGERNARDFGRFIPIDVFIAEGLLDTMNEVYAKFFDMESSDLIDNYLEQFYQHNPIRAFAGNSSEIEGQNMFNKDLSTAKSISDTYSFKVDVESEMGSKGFSAKYIYFYHDYEQHLFKLVKQEDGNLYYERLPLLGDKTNLLTEYDITTSNKRSIFGKQENYKTITPESRTDIKPKPPVEKTGISILNEFKYRHRANNLNEVLTSMSLNPNVNSGFRKLASIYGTQDFSDWTTLMEDSNFKLWSKIDGGAVFGAVIPSQNLMILNIDEVKPNFGLDVYNFFALGFLHEMTHVLTSNKINNRESLPEKEKEIINKIEKNWLLAKKEVEAQNIEEFKKYTDSLKEFISGLSSDPTFQKFLNEVKAADNVSILEKIIELLTELVGLIDSSINIKTDSVLAQALQDVLRLGVGLKTETIASKNLSSSVLSEIIYSKLGTKTKSKHIVIKPLSELSNKGGILPDGSINTLRNSNSKTHFGNPFDSKDTNTIKVSSTKDAVKLFIEWAGTNEQYASVLDINGDPIDLWSVDPERRLWIINQIKSGELVGKPLLYYTELGEPSHATALDYLINMDTWEESGTQGSWVPTDESPIYKEISGGNLYKFELTGGIVSKGYYAQGNSLDWKEMNPKNASKKYNEIEKDAMESTGKFIIVKDQKEEVVEEKPVGNIFTFSDGIQIDTGNLTLNDQQKAALQKAVDAINSGKSKFVLRGYAGTGKSTVAKFVEQYIDKKYNYGKPVVYLAPTHKAKTNLEIMLIRGGNTSKPHTVAKALNMRKIDGKFVPGPFHKIPSRGVLIVDESSMINDFDYNNLTAKASILGTTIIYMGDPAQLPPVGKSEVSKALNYDANSGIELTQIMRQTGENPILDILTSLRNNLSSLTESFNFETNINSKNEGVVFTKDNNKFEELIIKYFNSPQFEQDPTFAKILTYTNNSVFSYNQLIAGILNKENFAPGAILMGYEQSVSEPKIHNGQDYKVLTNEYVKEQDVSVYEGVHPKVGKFVKISSKVSGYKLLVQRVFSPSDSKLVEEYSKELLEPMEILVLNPRDPINIKFMTELTELKKVAQDSTIPWKQRSGLSEQLDAIFEYYQLPDDIVNYEGTVTTMSILKQQRPEIFKRDSEGKTIFEKSTNTAVITKNIDYGYAVTSHKGQGSTYQNVFVDYNNMENPMNNRNISDSGKVYGNERNMLKYVGMSRTSKLLFVLSSKTRKEAGDNQIADLFEISKKSTTFVINKSYQDLIDSYELIKEDLKEYGVLNSDMIKQLNQNQIGNIIRKYCK